MRGLYYLVYSETVKLFSFSSSSEVEEDLNPGKDCNVSVIIQFTLSDTLSLSHTHTNRHTQASAQQNILSKRLIF